MHATLADLFSLYAFPVYTVRDQSLAVAGRPQYLFYPQQTVGVKPTSRTTAGWRPATPINSDLCRPCQNEAWSNGYGTAGIKGMQFQTRGARFFLLCLIPVWLNPDKHDHDVTGKTKYIKVCSDLGVTPVTSYLESLHEREINLKFYGLSVTSAKAISVPLEVINTISPPSPPPKEKYNSKSL